MIICGFPLDKIKTFQFLLKNEDKQILPCITMKLSVLMEEQHQGITDKQRDNLDWTGMDVDMI